MKGNTRGEWALFAVMLLATLIVIPVMLAQRAECRDRGGSFVRGVFWFECVQVAP